MAKREKAKKMANISKPPKRMGNPRRGREKNKNAPRRGNYYLRFN